MNYDKIKKVFCDISVSAEYNLSCFSVRCYDEDYNPIDHYAGIFEPFGGRHNTAQCEIMVTTLVMETMPKDWSGTLYTDHSGVLQLWEHKEKQKSIVSLIPDKEARTRFHNAYRKVYASVVQLKGVHVTDIVGECCGKQATKMWQDVKIEQAIHLECDRDCASILRDYKKWSNFICLEET